MHNTNERTCKCERNVVWIRLTHATDETNTSPVTEVFRFGPGNIVRFRRENGVTLLFDSSGNLVAKVKESDCFILKQIEFVLTVGGYFYHHDVAD